MIRENLPALLVTGPLAGALLVPVVTLLSARAAEWLVRFASFGVLVAALALFDRVAREGTWTYEMGGWAPPWGIEYVLDPLAVFFAVLIALTSFLGSVYAGSYHRHWRPSARGAFSSLYLLLTSGLLGIVSTGDLFNLFVFFEISALAAYGMLAAGGDRAVISTFRYVLVGTVGASFYLLGLGHLYALTGSLNLRDLADHLPVLIASRPAAVAAALMAVGMAAKTAVFPFHAWLPDAYAYAPAPAAAFVSAVMTKVGAYALLRILFFLFAAGGPAREILDWLAFAAAAGMVVGSALAVSQRDVRRMLGYSSVGQISAVVLGVALGTPLALTAALFHAAAHAVMKQGLFFVAGGVLASAGARDVPDYRGLARRYPLSFAALLVFAASMVGVPPTAGFFSKWYLLLGCFEAGKLYFAAAIAGSALLSAAYFFRVVEEAFLREPARLPPPPGKPELPLAQLSPILLLGTAVLLMGLFNRPLIELAVAPALPHRPLPSAVLSTAQRF